MAGRPKRRARLAAETGQTQAPVPTPAQKHRPPAETPQERKQRRRERTARKVAKAGGPPPSVAHLEEVYAGRINTFDALRRTMVQKGIVDHGINPYDVIQRAIDDTATDYILVRQAIDRDTHGDPEQIEDHKLYPFMERIREAMVRYSTFAMQYDIQKRQLKLSESRVALLAVTLRAVLLKLDLNQEQIKKVPRLLIEEIQAQEAPRTRNFQGTAAPRLDAHKAEALAEILHYDSEVEIIDVTPADEDAA